MSDPQLFVNLSVPRRAAEAAAEWIDGVGLMRGEFLVFRSGRHPRLLLNDAPPNDLSTILGDGMRAVARAMAPRPVYYRSLDLLSNEVRRLAGGEAFEPEEENPVIGCRGLTRSRRDPDVFDAELRAFEAIRDEGYDNLHLLLPFVRWPEEVKWARTRLHAASSKGASTAQIWMMVETPGAVLRAGDFAALVDGVSIGSNDLTQLILAVDRDNVAFGNRPWDDPAVLSGIRWAVQTYADLDVPVSISGDAPSQSTELLESMLDWGMASISVSLDRASALREMLDRRSGRNRMVSAEMNTTDGQHGHRV